MAPLLVNATAETKEIVAQVVADHAKLQHGFQEPTQYRQEFKWPFQYDTKSQKYTKGKETYSKLIKMIKGSPGKARHDGLTLHILSRFPCEFFKAYEQLENLVLACRYQPKTSAAQTVALLAKDNGDPTDRRPISLSSDAPAHWSGRVQQYYSDALVHSGVIPPENKAFTKHSAVEETTLEHACAVEDSLQFGTFMAEVCDDMEKMYNMVGGKLQLHLNYQATGTHYGYGEWIAEDQREPPVFIRSPECQLLLKQTYGLRQGKGLSCPIALLVTADLMFV
mmetsp:Transcript_9209/g.25887  ORF Transcript_9209/g.25887 Transcript_9209/m.25887 type:complete len:280 (+) Transcript_9209:737-1576(+)